MIHSPMHITVFSLITYTCEIAIINNDHIYTCASYDSLTNWNYMGLRTKIHIWKAQVAKSCKLVVLYLSLLVPGVSEVASSTSNFEPVPYNIHVQVQKLATNCTSPIEIHLHLCILREIHYKYCSTQYFCVLDNELRENSLMLKASDIPNRPI